MAESKRQGHHQRAALDEDLLVKRERMFLVTFAFGAVSLVSGMFWIADGLSSNFKVTTATFIVFVVAAGLSTASSVTSKILFRAK